MQTTPRKKSWARHAKLAFRKRWVQVLVVFLIYVLSGLLTVPLLGPKQIAKGDTSSFKFMHCPVCKLELPFNKDMKKCPKCIKGNVGFLVPTARSLKDGALADPWRWIYAAWFVETIAMLSGVVYLLYLPVVDLTKVYYILACPYCSQRLRYRAVSLGGIGSCSRCKRMLRFPEEEDAILEEDMLKADEQAAIAEEMARRAELEQQ
jgi:uncharacterized protein YbaR (Trm112 family)